MIPVAQVPADGTPKGTTTGAELLSVLARDIGSRSALRPEDRRLRSARSVLGGEQRGDSSLGFGRGGQHGGVDRDRG